MDKIWGRHVSNITNAYNILVGKSERKSPLGRE
jgi:hypothetical protein